MTGSIYQLSSFPCFAVLGGSENTPDAGKNSTKSVIVTPLLVRPKC